MIIGTGDALLQICPTAEFVLLNGKITEWHSPGITQPTETEINNKVLQLEAEESVRLVRERRNRLLTESDWTQTRDNVRLNDSAWITYRQELRDITKSASFTPKLNDDRTLDESSVTWPLKPSS